MSDHGAQLIRSRCSFYGGRKTGKPGEKPSKHGRDQLQQLYSQKFQYIWPPGYTQVVTHPAKPVRPGLTSNSEVFKPPITLFNRKPLASRVFFIFFEMSSSYTGIWSMTWCWKQRFKHRLYVRELFLSDEGPMQYASKR